MGAQIDEYITTAEAAALKKCAQQTILSWIRQGKISARRLGRAYLVPRDEVERMAISPRGRPSEPIIRRIVREEIERSAERIREIVREEIGRVLDEFNEP